MAPGTKAPERSATSWYRHRFSGLGVSGFARSWSRVAIPTMPLVPSTRSSTNAASNCRRLLSHVGSRRPGEYANRTVRTVPGASGTHAWSARSARVGVGCEVAEQVDGECARPQQVRPVALVVEALVRLPERPHGHGRPRARPTSGTSRRSRGPRRGAADCRPGVHPCPGLGTIGSVPMGYPRSDRQRACRSRRLRRYAVMAGRPGTRSSASQQWAASSSSRSGSGRLPDAGRAVRSLTAPL